MSPSDVGGVPNDERGAPPWVLPPTTTRRPPSFPVVPLGSCDGHDVTVPLHERGTLLLVGPTGSGKSVVLHHIIAALLATRTPDEARLLLIDPHRVEFQLYRHLPHLLTAPIDDPAKGASAIEWAEREVRRRIDEPTSIQGRDPDLLVVVDDLSGLLETAEERMLSSLSTLVSYGRRVGVHVVVAAQPTAAARVAHLVGTTARLVHRMATRGDLRTFTEVDLISNSPDRHVAQLVEAMPRRDTLVTLPALDETLLEELVLHWRRQASTVPASTLGIVDPAPAARCD